MGPSAIRYAGLNDRLQGLGYEVLDWGDVETAVLEATEETDSTARYLPEIKAACGRVGTPRRPGARAGRAAARARRRPLGRDGDARRPRTSPGRRRRALDRRPLRHEHARDVAERQRPRDAARSSARLRGRPLRERCLVAARGRAVARGARRAPLGRLAGARADPRARDQGVHDERHRPDRDRAGDPGVALAHRRPRLRPRLVRHGRARPRGGAGRRHAGARRPLLPGGAPRARARRRVRPRWARSRWSR